MKVLVLGASPNPNRYSNIATLRLKEHGHDVVAVGQRKGEIAGIEIQTENPLVEDVHTLTLYVGPKNQLAIADYIKEINPKRVIFNPGTENLEFQEELEALGIEVEVACTLVLLSIGNF